jgi:protocatechuate 3,4-dioxygenase, beta subunit
MDRRTFITALIAAPGLLTARRAFSCPDAARAPAAAFEPGAPLQVTGTVYAADGRTPLPDMRLFLYHTDREGMYARPRNDARQATHRFTIVTDDAGRYTLRTIVPGHYPDRAGPAHIHLHLAGPGVDDHWLESFLFAGDPKLRDRDRETARGQGRFAHILVARREAGGTWHGARDLRLDPVLVERNRLVDGWYRQ